MDWLDGLLLLADLVLQLGLAEEAGTAGDVFPGPGLLADSPGVLVGLQVAPVCLGVEGEVSAVVLLPAESPAVPHTGHVIVRGQVEVVARVGQT